MASWNNSYGLPNWQGNGTTVKARNLKVSSITADTITTNELYASTISSYSLYSDVIHAKEVNTSTLRGSNIFGFNNYLDYIQNVNLITNVITLDGQGLTATVGGLYLNGNLIGTPSSINSIDYWAQFKAISDVNMANSTIKNALGISSIYVSTGSIRANTINTNSFTTNSINATTGAITTLSSSNINAYNVVLSNQITVPQMKSVFISTGTIQADAVIANIGDYQDIVVSNIVADVATIRVLNNRVGLISTCGIDFLSSGRIRGALGSFSTIQTNSVSTGFLEVSSIRASNAVIHSLITDYIFNTYTINTSNLTSVGLIQASNIDVSGNLVVDGNTTLNNDLQMNGNINFPTNTVYSVDYPDGLNQYLKDINNLRNLNVEKINVLGGSTGNEFFPPLRNDSIVNVGEDLLSPGQVIINGFNPDPLDTGIALTVRGDTQMVQNLNVLGLTTAEGDLTVVGLTSLNGDVNVLGLATFEGNIDVVGVGTFEGAVNVAGALAVEGETNLAGALTCEAGIGIAGALGLTGGNATFGSAIDSHTFTNYYYTDIKNSLNVNNNLTIGGTIHGSALNITSGYISSLNTSTLNTSSMNVFTLNLMSNIKIEPPYPAWNSNTLYSIGDLANYNSFNYVATATNRNNPPTEPIPLWINGTPYELGNVVRVVGVGDYVCVLSYSGGSTPPNGDYAHWYPSSSILWNFDSFTEGASVSHIKGDKESYINIGYVSTLNTVSKNLSSYTGYISSLKTTSLIGDFVNISTFYASTIVNQQLASFKIFNSSIHTQEIIVDNSNNAFITFKDMSNNDLGILGKPEGTNTLFTVASSKILALQSVQQTIIQSLETVGIQAPNIAFDGNTTLSNGVLNMYSTIYMNSNTIHHISSLSYTDSNFEFPTYVGGQIQHWDASGGIYNYFIPQLWYSDLTNNSNCAIASDWSYYPCKNLNLDMNSNYITNCAGLTTKQLVVPQATLQENGYTDAGIIFSQNPGDTLFWSLVKPVISGTDPQGSEGIYITTRSTEDGAMNNLGRLFDDVIYTPWDHIGGALTMGLNSIYFTDQSTTIDYGITFNNNFLQYTDTRVGISHYVAQDWSYFQAEHYVDMSGNDIKNGGQIKGHQLVASSNISYSNILQPIIQCGNGNTGASGTTITLPTAYPSSNYQIQLTYHGQPSGNKPIYHLTVTSSNFVVKGDNNAAFDWTTFYVP
jgi:cytoskeletal protein CcmA (bactofilin family)